MICNGPFCKGKDLPESRFSKSRSSKSGFKSVCKMCEGNKKVPNFTPGICAKCCKEHDCSFGIGAYCSRFCNSVVTKKEENIPKTKICSDENCPFAGAEQPIVNFYKRSGRSTIKSKCKNCEMNDNRKYRSTLYGCIKKALLAAKQRARKYNRELNITFDDALKIYNSQNGKCAISGETLTTMIGDGKGTKTHSNMSLDRIDSSKGYSIDNVQWVAIWIQIAKSDWNQNDFESWIVTAADFIKNKPVKAELKSEILDKDTFPYKKFNVTKEELFNLVHTKKMSYTSIGKHFGVSDNAIRKRCLALGISLRKIKQI